MDDSLTRQQIVDRLRQDLIGPSGADEVIDDWPSDRYLTGILFPRHTVFDAAENDEAETAEDSFSVGSGNGAVSLSSGFRPASAGLSFAVAPGEDGVAAISILVEAARYEPVGSKESSTPQNSSLLHWRRVPVKASHEELLEMGGMLSVPLTEQGLPNVNLHLRISSWGEKFLVTATITNDSLPKGNGRKQAEEATYFQTRINVTPMLGARLCEKPSPKIDDLQDSDDRSAALIYREAAEYAVGHTCSVNWEEENGCVNSISTDWIPESTVKASKSSGDSVFEGLDDQLYKPLETKWLSEAGKDDLIAGLALLPKLYSDWIETQSKNVEWISESLHAQASENLGNCQHAQQRIESGIDLLKHDSKARDAFQLANRAIWMQHSWKTAPDSAGSRDLVWRPFQLAFVLLCLSSTSNGDDPHRNTMDLLWFPTGGGKTEAYLLLTAYVIYLRRLRAAGKSEGGGVSVFMRYTLRLLTIQQFQRAAALVCACDLIRDGSVSSGIVKVPQYFSNDEPISIGLWVGQAATPNTTDKAVEALKEGLSSSPAQLSHCPVCSKDLSWSANDTEDCVEVYCLNSECSLGKRSGPLPVWTVDEEIYRALPSLMIGTADKYAQLPRKKETGRLFGLGGATKNAPDLIVQDELHLIAGPLGTLAGVYEIAVDELCTRNDVGPKVIGSTATIRRADEQIRALFNREAFQFPPQGLDHGNSGFSTVDEERPGRLYVGVTTTGRSAKFTLQAVAASLLQSGNSPQIPDDDRDAYWTLVNYFNSLRELGSALVLMRDDVERSIEMYARRRKEGPREISRQIELTSRVSSADIPGMLDQMARDRGHDDCVDVVLASNMISVGVDVSRLGMMLVNGQPKGIAEYIQATSRVGRSQVPGLVVTVYNVNKSRDRSRYESFSGWHQSLYRDVEATSVTPFAPRARDRALHAAFVAIVRHTVPGMHTEPVDAGKHEKEIREIIDRMVERAYVVDPEEADAVRSTLENYLQKWMARGVLDKYWDDWGDKGLLLSAEAAAERAINQKSARSGWPTPNSLRSVEASTSFVLLGGLHAKDGSYEK